MDFKSLLSRLGLAEFAGGLQAFGASSIEDITQLHDADFVELGMTRIQMRRLQNSLSAVPCVSPESSQTHPVAVSENSCQDAVLDARCSKGKRRYVDQPPHMLPGVVLPMTANEPRIAGRAWAQKEGIDIVSARTPYPTVGGYAWIARCVGSKECLSGRGHTYRFVCRDKSGVCEFVVGATSSGGSDRCVDGDSILKKTRDRTPAFRGDPRLVRGAVNTLVCQGIRPTPFLVQAEIPDRRIPPRSIRNLLRPLRRGGFASTAWKLPTKGQRVKRRGCVPVEWSDELETFALERSRFDSCEGLYFAQKVFGGAITSFVVLVPRFFRDCRLYSRTASLILA